MNPSKNTRVVAFVSRHLSVSAPTINALEDAGFDVRHCRSAVDAIELFSTPVTEERPTVLISDTMIYNPHFDLLSEAQTTEKVIEDNPGVVLYKYLRATHKGLKVILFTHDVLEKEQLESVKEERAGLQVILVTSHLTRDILRALEKKFPVKTTGREKFRDPDTAEHTARKALKRRNLQLAANH